MIISCMNFVIKKKVYIHSLLDIDLTRALISKCILQYRKSSNSKIFLVFPESSFC